MYNRYKIKCIYCKMINVDVLQMQMQLNMHTRFLCDLDSNDM